MTEFALIAPVFFLLLTGGFDFGLMMFTIGSARFAAADAARVEAQQGNQPNQNGCDATCARLNLGQGTRRTACDADCRAIVSIANSSLETTNLARILEIDIIKETSTNGVISDSSPLVANKFTSSGAICLPYTVTYRNGGTRSFCGTGATAYPPVPNSPTLGRNVIFGQADILKVDIVYEYDWKAGLMNTVFPEPPLLHASYLVTLEPQGYR